MPPSLHGMSRRAANINAATADRAGSLQDGMQQTVTPTSTASRTWFARCTKRDFYGSAYRKSLISAITAVASAAAKVRHPTRSAPTGQPDEP
jgi:hypothetical protein